MKVILDFKAGQYVRFIEALRTYAVAEDDYTSAPVDDGELLDDLANTLKVAATDVLDAMWDAIPGYVIDEIEQDDLF